MALATKEKARATPGAFALADERQTITWGELEPILNRAVNALVAKPGLQRVAVFAQNSAEAAVAYLAAMHAGVSSVPANFHFTADELAYILRDSGAKIVFAGPETAAAAKAAADQVGGVEVVAWRSPPTAGVTAWDAWLAAASDAEPPTDRPPQPHLHYTSGTTGRPKGVETPPTLWPRKATVREFVELLQAQTPAEHAPSLVVSPLYHTSPLRSLRALAGGAPMVLMSRFDAERVLQTIDRYRIASTVMVPTHFQRLLALPEEVRRKYDVSSLALVYHTGAACPVDVKRAMIAWFGPVFVEAYGGTESGAVCTITSQEWLQKPGSVGCAKPPFELVVVGEDGERLGANRPGQLYFRDTTGRGIIYHNDEAKTRAAHLEPGVFTLGEVGYFDDDGYLFITDRVSDMIVSGGVNIYPAETEQVLLQHPKVADAAVVGAPNAEMGEEVKALVVPKDLKDPPTAEELDQFCRERLAGYKRPRTYDIVEDIGRNAMGKVNKRELRRRYWPTERTIG